MYQVPKIYSVVEIKSHEGTAPSEPHDIWRRRKIGDTWLPSRPLGLLGFYWLKRFKVAFKVFVGRYDAIDWDSDKGAR